MKTTNAPVPSTPRRLSALRHMPLVTAVVMGVLFALPLLWVLAGSLRPGDKVLAGLDRVSWHSLIPTDATLHNYVTLFRGDFGRAVLNSIGVAVATVLLGLVLSAMAAFALSVFRFRGRGLVFAVILLSFMIPFDAIAIPLSDIFRDWGLQNTYAGLILPGIGNGLAIFLLRQFFLAIPRELVEAARMDGLSWWGVFTKIYVPLSRPALIGAGLTLFTFQWQSYMWPLLVGTEPDKQLGPIALGTLQGQMVVDYGQVFAAAVVLTVIPLLVLLRLQRYFTQSIAGSGLK
ncbi:MULTISPECIES: carbohydrate ABC transporter permease [unclassified Streptomyces]|uniref:carbohydrate ABC transporter permease n=1 Tax=unclassified Streptomyces TaxID=2593676 RepID=UPI002259935D|nr:MULTISPECIES: carbohydrate ABC transporter permease [unclassified Streptomyces]MCX4536700.1 carbohydrate ABC transporter permease [Streptomyces sp. NBC_01669]WRZ98086.1 carbohydrate ABC transporter permease [Streptomyces sp. NBC_00841]